MENVRCGNNPFCRSLDQETRAKLCAAAKPRVYRRDQLIYVSTDEVILLKKGRAITLREREDGRQKGIEYLEDGDIIGVSRLFSNALLTARTITAWTKTPVEACLFARGAFERLCLQHMDLSRQVIGSLSRRFAACIDQLEHVSLDKSEERILFVAELLDSRQAHHEPTHVIPLTQRELAVLAGLNRVTATRAIDRLKRSGKLATRRGAVLLTRTSS